MPRLSLVVIVLALFLLARAWPRSKTVETVPPTQSAALPVPVAIHHDAHDTYVVPEPSARTVLVVPGSLTFPPSNWTHTDLVSYLEMKGVRAEVESGGPFNHPERPAIVLRSGSDANDTYAAVLVYRCKDARSARVTSTRMGPNSFSRGAFAFGPSAVTTQTATLLRSISTALSQQPFN